MNHSEIVSFLWGVADPIRDSFKRGKYQDVILPFTVLRRIDCVLAPTKPKVLATRAKLRGKLENLDPQLRKASGHVFYDTSRYDFEELMPQSVTISLLATRRWHSLPHSKLTVFTDTKRHRPAVAIEGG